MKRGAKDKMYNIRELLGNATMAYTNMKKMLIVKKLLKVYLICFKKIKKI